jgi:hypothetical protein
MDALVSMYSDLPVREMADRGWFGDVGEGEAVAVVEGGFLAFWGVRSHDDVRGVIGGEPAPQEEARKCGDCGEPLPHVGPDYWTCGRAACPATHRAYAAEPAPTSEDE